MYYSETPLKPLTSEAFLEFYCFERQKPLRGEKTKRQMTTGLFQNTIILFAVPPKFCISIVINFSWNLQSPQEKQKTILQQNFGGTKKSMMLLLRKAYSN